MPVAATQTLPEFWDAKLHQSVLDPKAEQGHFAVSRLEDFPTDTDLTAVYGRKNFYKIMFGTGHATHHYGGQ